MKRISISVDNETFKRLQMCKSKFSLSKFCYIILKDFVSRGAHIITEEGKPKKNNTIGMIFIFFAVYGFLYFISNLIAFIAGLI
jgi:hypothetical protein